MIIHETKNKVNKQPNPNKHIKNPQEGQLTFCPNIDRSAILKVYS